MRRTLLAALAAACTAAAAPDSGAPAPDGGAPAPDAGASLPAGGRSKASNALVLGIGQPNGEEHAKRAAGLIEPLLGKKLGRPVTVRILTGYDELSASLSSGSVDVGWMTPIAFADAQVNDPKVKALVKARRNGVLFYRTAFVVKKDAAANALGDLRGKRVAWVSPSSASGYIFARAMLAGAGQDPTTFFGSEAFLGTHPAVCRAVRDGSADVGATLADPPAPGKEGMQADGCFDSPPITDFRVIAASEPIPNDVIAVRSGLEAKTVEAIRNAFDKMGESPEGAKVLADAFRVEGWVPASAKDLATVLRVREIGRLKAPAADGGTRAP